MAALILLLGYESKAAVIQSVFITLVTARALTRYGMAGYVDFPLPSPRFRRRRRGNLGRRPQQKTHRPADHPGLQCHLIMAIVILQSARIVNHH